MKQIALVPTSVLPIPAVKGGAVETLMTLLADENEKHGLVQFHIFSVYDEEAERRTRKYTHSQFHFIKTCQSKLITKMVFFFSRVIRKFFIHDFIISEFYRKVFKICKESDFDFIVREGGTSDAFRRFTKEFGKEKILLHMHCHMLFEPKLAGIYGATIAVSHFVNAAWCESLKNYPSEQDQKHFVVVNAVDEELFKKEVTAKERNEIRSGLGVQENDILLLYIGRIVEVKGVLELIEATLAIKDPRIKLLVIGSVNFAANETSEYFKKVTDLIQQYPDKIKQLGYIDNSQVFKYAKCADIRVFPAKWEEAGSLALVEAIHAGIPLIITRSGGMPEVVSEHGAIIIDKDTNLVQNITSAVTEIINTPGKTEQMREANALQSEKFKKERFYQNFINMFEHL